MGRNHYDDVTFTETLPVGIDGYYNHLDNRIYVRRGLHPFREVSVIAHEREHKYERHQPANTLPEYHAREIKVEAIAARKLIPFPKLLEAFTSHASIESMSRMLGVDAGMICARMLDLTDLEQTMLNMCAFHCLTNKRNAAILN